MTGGVDTHLDVHVAAALDPVGALLGSESFETTPAGYAQLLNWLEGFGPVTKVGVEGTGAYRARRSRSSAAGVSKSSRSTGPTARPAAARESLIPSTLSRRPGRLCLDVPKATPSPTTVRRGHRVPVVASRSATRARAKAIAQMRHLVVTAPDQLGTL